MIFIKVPPISNFMKIHLVGAALTHADGRTDVTKVKGAFHDYANAPKKPLSGSSCLPVSTMEQLGSHWIRHQTSTPPLGLHGPF
jgi:hypothetical protein